MLLSKTKIANFFNRIGRPFAIAVLVYCSFFDLIPEALEDDTLSILEVTLLVLVGLISCLIVGFIVGRFHKHGEKKTFHSKAESYSMLVVDSLHTIVDGIVIGAAFATSTSTGLFTALATATHEIPQEIGDFGIMIRSQISKNQILKLQIASALLLVPSAVLSYFIGNNLLPILPPFMSLTAGFFLYIALEELSAMIKEFKEKRS